MLEAARASPHKFTSNFESGNTAENTQLPDHKSNEFKSDNVGNKQHEPLPVPQSHLDNSGTIEEHHHKHHSDTSITGKHAKMLQLPKNTFSNENTGDNGDMPEPLVLENEAEREFSSIPSGTSSPHHHHEHGNGKHWPQFAYHRVTANPAETQR